MKRQNPLCLFCGCPPQKTRALPGGAFRRTPSVGPSGVLPQGLAGASYAHQQTGMSPPSAVSLRALRACSVACRPKPPAKCPEPRIRKQPVHSGIPRPDFPKRKSVPSHGLKIGSLAPIFLTASSVRGTFPSFDSSPVAGANRANSPLLRRGEPAQSSCDRTGVNRFFPDPHVAGPTAGGFHSSPETVSHSAGCSIWVFASSLA